MRRTLQTNRWRAQRGAIAVEAAFTLSVLVSFLLFPSLSWALYFYEYSAAQKAVHDAGLYLSTAPKLEMATAGPDGNPAALTIARKIITKEMAGMNPPDPGIVCSYRQASGYVLSKPCTTTNNQDYRQPLVGVSISLNMDYADPLTGISDKRISPYVTVSYAGD